jgi:hypothetical protein
MAEQLEAVMLCKACGAPLAPGASKVEVFLEFCADAWFGRRPALRHFNLGLTTVFDESGPAARARDYNAINVMVMA